ncbi:MAG: hypothetical protein RLZZ299_1506 [Pseudomonadota bacterium]|jgi:dethiobiotin synthetase
MTPARWFVTGTDTGVGKTEAACALLSLLAEAGARPAAFKPYESGWTPGIPGDTEALWRAGGATESTQAVNVYRFRAPLAPAVAAAKEGVTPSFARVEQAYRDLDGRSLVVEGAGGLFVPVDEAHDVIDLVARWRLPVVLVARAGLGTLNHVGLSLAALAAREVPVAAVLLNRTRRAGDPSERDNAELLRRRHGVQVLGPVPHTADAHRRRSLFRRALAPLVRAAGDTERGR